MRAIASHPVHLLAPTGVIAVLMACQEPFGSDRHDLEGDRIAAIVSDPAASTAEATVVRPLLVVGGHLWAEEPVDLRWYVTDAQDAAGLDAIDASAPPDAAGPAPALPPGRHALIAAFPSGAERRAVIDVAASPTLTPPDRLEVGLLDIDVEEPEEDALTLEARAAATPTPAEVIPRDRWARFTAAWDAPPADLDRVRWMATDPTGTFLELDATRTDWASALVTLDELEVEAATPLDAGVLTVLALALDGAGANAALAWDVAVGESAPDAPRVRGRYLDTGGVTGARLVGQLVAADDARVGVRLDGAVATDAPVTADDPDGTRSLPCTRPVSGPFDPNWLLDGRCARAQVVGRTVAVVP